MPLVVSSMASGGRELKFYPQLLTTNLGSVSTAMSTQTLTGQIQIGTALTQRVGRSIHIKRISLDGILVGGQSNLATDDNRNTVRLVCAEMDVGASLSIAVGDILDPRTQRGIQRIYYDQLIFLQSPGRDSTGYMPAMRRVSISLPINRDLSYVTDGLNGESRTYFAWFMVSDSLLAANPGFTSGATLTEYTDN